MSVIDTTLENWQKVKEEKKKNLTIEHEKYSKWLESEFSKIRVLMGIDSSDLIPLDLSTSHDVKEVEVKNVKEVQENMSKKRKSPETALNSVKLSPEQKRISYDIEELIRLANFPVKLDKMTKPQLMKELEKRGDTTCTMKSLRNEMVESLKECLINEKKAEVSSQANSDEHNYHQQQFVSIDASIEGDQATQEETVTTAVTIAAAPTATESTKRLSMAEIRENVVKGGLMSSSNISSSNQVTADEGKSKISEFRARQERKSVLTTEASSTTATENEIKQVEEQMKHVEITIAAPVTIQKAPALLAAPVTAPIIARAASPVKPNTVQETPKATVQTHKEEEEDKGLWMEVSSPVKAFSPVKEAPVPIPVAPAPIPVPAVIIVPGVKAKAEEPVVAPVVAPGVSNLTKPSRSGSMEDNASVKSVETTVSSTSQPAGSVVVGAKKPNNLVSLAGQQTSFLDKAPPAKSVVAALEKAKQAKAAEEAKQLQKKEHKAMMKAHPSSATNVGVPTIIKPSTTTAAAPVQSAQSTAVVKEAPASTVAPPPSSPWDKIKKGLNKVTTNDTAAASSKDTTASSTAASNNSSNPPKKAGFFGNMFGGSKEAAVVATAKPTPVTATALPTAVSTAAVPAMAAAPGGFDVHVVENKKASPTVTPATVAAVPVAGVPPPSLAVANGGGVKKTAVSEIVKNYQTAITSPAPAVQQHQPMMMSPVAAKKMNEGQQGENLPPAVSSAQPTVAAPQPPRTENILQEIPLASVKTATAPPAIVAPAASQNSKPSAQKPAATTAAAAVQGDEENEDDRANEYQIQDRESSDEDDDSGTDDENDANEKKKQQQQQVPDWARTDNLREALERQYGLHGHVPVDPDLIFHEVQSCSLEEIFGQRQGLTRKYKDRTSSAHWEPDQLTPVEKRQYRVHMGYDQQGRPISVARK